MSRTRKDRDKQMKIVRNSFLKKVCQTYGDDFKGRRSRAFTGGQVRRKIKRLKDRDMI